jgi:hypothetical protein
MNNEYSEFDIQHPTIYKNKWMIFDDAVFSNINTLDCSNTVEGQCYTDKTFEQCVQMCDDHSDCTFGYYISNGPSKKKNWCVPIRELTHEINPVRRLRNKNTYPELNDRDAKVFISNQDTYNTWPPNQLNTVFFFDKFVLYNTETDMSLSSKFPLNNDPVIFEQLGNLPIQLLEIPPDLDADGRYVSVTYGDKVLFNIPNTIFTMGKSDTDDTLSWESRSFIRTNARSYFMSPVSIQNNESNKNSKEKKNGDKIEYGDTFCIHSNVSVVGVEGDQLKLYYMDYKDAKSNGLNVTFKFIPKSIGFYCDDGKCKQVSLDKVDSDGKYQGMQVYRNPKCWNMCSSNKNNENFAMKEYGSTNQSKSLPLCWIIFIVILCGIIAIIINAGRRVVEMR